MPQRSTEDALYILLQNIRSKLAKKKITTLVSLDIEGAFDSAWWPMISVRLAEEKCPAGLARVMGDYMRDRTVGVRYMGVEHRRATEKGCVQGSIGGPILWNLLLDPLLKGLQEGGHYVQAFADDVVLLFEGDTGQEVERRANAALEYVRAWGVKNKLKFAPHKTCAMVITNKLKYDTPRLTMGGIGIGMSQSIKLLGLTIDHRLTFNTHITNVCAKAAAVYGQLSRAAKVTWGLHPEVIRRIYTAVVEPIVLYASSAWAPASKKLGAQKQLNALQRSFAQKLCRAYRTTSLNATLLLAGILPLDLRVRESATLYEAKRGVPQPAIGDREVERMTSALVRPHPAEQTELELGRLVDEEQLRNNSNFAVRIFTDGSKIEGKVGAALSIWRGEAETKTLKLKLALPTYCTVYQAELLALCEAAKEANKRKEATFAVYSDSMAALQTVVNPAALHPLAVETRDAIKNCNTQNKSVSLFWVKAHAGLEGNERADILAKEAALGSKCRPKYDRCPVSYVKRIIRSESLDEWGRRYSLGTTAKITKMYFPSAIDAYRIVRKINLDHEVTQALTGHGGFSEYLTRFKCKEDPTCICEPGQLETLPHLVSECPQFEKERYEVEQKLEIELKPKNWPKLVMNKSKRELFIIYLRKIVKVVNKRNETNNIR
ncbi:uncharacterized protein LOC142978606 [Anticarsia gemmatalis]|uniref:uncharacterized protein LOC142978606 n=1 Tax=Anticarsia gemmatalis TaxID=129554 RepID=UPI003F76B00E